MHPQPEWSPIERTRRANLRVVTGPPSGYDRNLIDEFVARADVGDDTRAKYRTHLTEYDAWLNHPNTPREHGPIELVDAEPTDIDDFLAYLQSDRYAARALPRATRPMGASARKSALGTLRAFYRYLVLRRLVVHDPTLHIKTPKVRIRPGLVLTPEELRALLDVPGSARERIQTYLLAYTGARCDEIRRLRWCDIDLREATMLLCGKRERYRVIDIHPILMGELRLWLVTQLDEAVANPAVAAAKTSPDTDHVLLTRSGRMLAKTTIGRQLKRRAVHAGIRIVATGDDVTSRVSPHALRRTFATILLNSGQPLDAVADVLGHRFVDTTRTHYAFTSNARRRATIHAFHI